ncbi:unnamed protein product [Arctogadus glacialis]
MSSVKIYLVRQRKRSPDIKRGTLSFYGNPHPRAGPSGVLPPEDAEDSLIALQTASNGSEQRGRGQVLEEIMERSAGTWRRISSRQLAHPRPL